MFRSSKHGTIKRSSFKKRDEKPCLTPDRTISLRLIRINIPETSSSVMAIDAAIKTVKSLTKSFIKNYSNKLRNP